MKTARCAVCVATDAAVAHVCLQRERLGGDCDGVLHTLAVTGRCQRLCCRIHDGLFLLLRKNEEEGKISFVGK